ncbi:MAG: hypothetical protein NTW60_01295 [Candidatus Wolfebacteria bacterium]|nr:hypothetical protein [Candidatus Wolfebacteria bacterium]
MSLEDKEKNLYRKENEPEKISPSVLDLKRAQGIDVKDSLPPAWKKEIPKEKSGIPVSDETLSKFGSYGKLAFWILSGTIVVLAGIAGLYYYQFSQNSGMSLSLTAPDNVLVGVPFEIVVDFNNGSVKETQDVKISMNIPDGAVLTDEPDKRVFEQSFGNLAPNSSLETKIPVTIFGSSDSVKKFTATVSYYPPSLGPKVRFEKNQSADIAVREPAIRLDMKAPQKVFSSENFELKLDYENISDYKFPNAQIEISYPSSFVFKKATPAATLSNNIWAIDELEKGAGGTIVIQGNILGSEKSFFDFNAIVKSPNGEISRKNTSVNIAQSPLLVSISLKNQDNYISKPDDDLRYILTYTNNSEVGLNDVVIKAKFTGEMFDISNIQTKGYFTSQNNTVTWNVSNVPELRVVAPGVSGWVEFNIRTKQSYPIKRLSDKNFQLKVDAEISSPTVLYYVSADKTTATASLTTKIMGRTALATKLLYRDSSSYPKNTGPIPPKVNFPTTFNIHWLITNYATDIKTIQLKSTLLAGVRFTGKTFSNISSVPSADAQTGEITWNIDSIAATKGVLDKPVEAVFQVEATPSVNQIGQPMPLIGDTTLTATDSFTNSPINASRPGITTF